MRTEEGRGAHIMEESVVKEKGMVEEGQDGFSSGKGTGGLKRGGGKGRNVLAFYGMVVVEGY